MTRDTQFQIEAEQLGCSFQGEIKKGGNYAPLIRVGPMIYLSGQISRVSDVVVVTGAAGAQASLQDAQKAAKVCALRALALLQAALGTLAHIEAIARVTVFTQSAPDFTQQSEVADAASDLLVRVLGSAGQHARTSVGVLQLPKNATVEIDMMVVAAAQPAH